MNRIAKDAGENGGASRRALHQIRKGFAILFATAAALMLLASAAFVVFVHVRRGEFHRRHHKFIRFALCQYDSRVGDLRWSFLHAMGYADEAVRNGADVIVLPEFSFTTLHDVRSSEAMFNILERPEFADRLIDFTRRNGCYLFFNHPYVTNEVGNATRPLFQNTSYVMGPDGGIVTNYVKQALALVDKRCGFSPGHADVMAHLPFGKVGLMICKDSSYPDHFLLYRDADLVTVQFAHITHWANTPAPSGLHEPTSSVLDKMGPISQECVDIFRRPILMVNKSGLEGEFAYVGDSRVVIANGTSIASAGSDCRILYVDFPLGRDGRIDRSRHPRIPENPVDYKIHHNHPWLWKLRRKLLRLEPRIP